MQARFLKPAEYSPIHPDSYERDQLESDFDGLLDRKDFSRSDYEQLTSIHTILKRVPQLGGHGRKALAHLEEALQTMRRQSEASR
jgi:uncharacterized protein YfkK (UPF0435 family)